jgi:malonate transporter and related proteins
MNTATLVIPIFAVIVTGWVCGRLRYISRSLADGLVHFAYNVAMPALLFVTIAQEPARNLFAWRFLLAFGGGSAVSMVVILVLATAWLHRDLRSSTMLALSASMTNTGFVALPILNSLYGAKAVLPAAIATVFVAAVMFPAGVILLEIRPQKARADKRSVVLLARHIVLNPMVLSTLLGVVWAASGLPIPQMVADYLNILAAALTPCALFAIGLGTTSDDVRANLGLSARLTVVKLVLLPLLVFGLSSVLALDPLYTIAAVICAAVPTAKTVYILAGEYHVEEPLVASTVSMTTLLSIVSLLGWIYFMSSVL